MLHLAQAIMIACESFAPEGLRPSTPAYSAA
jgi:hypothetical protein